MACDIYVEKKDPDCLPGRDIGFVFRESIIFHVRMCKMLVRNQTQKYNVPLHLEVEHQSSLTYFLISAKRGQILAVQLQIYLYYKDRISLVQDKEMIYHSLMHRPTQLG